MVENPPVPSIWRVASRTFGAKASFVMLVGMTGRALGRRFLEVFGAVAGGTADCGMKSYQRKARDVMIEGDAGRPRVFVMAFRAVGAERTLVRILFAVTAFAFGREFDRVDIVEMAGFAFCLFVSTPQRELCVTVVIKFDRLPFG